ncbi:response regulator transcription factor [Clostridium beijerinckii]|uniref:Stage 0 sporulation protein A homolog n=1 Tax=Clostridium beijerinckii TaxID=1520 RepID=A0A1S8SCS5_CLOBE|nr:response regulator [Clostridium beijerinckii]NRY61692.1 YesN/AraC family two-component response regulator [Clostridium beijerinckii]OOM63303.1 putative response regulatory protein [Clostridium beijerinckii]UYZ35831.1 response regulator [Clostridium beijerinckii]
MYKLLVVDDESESRNLLCSYFPWNDLGFEIVDQLENGKLALEYILNNPVNVILCDIKMPFLDGIGLAKEIFNRKLKIKVIFLSAYKDFEYAHSALVYGVSDYIVKPSKYNEIFEVFSSLKKSLDSECSPNVDKVLDEDINNFKDSSSYNSKIISFVKNYVSEHYKDARLEDIAESVHMNPNYLSQFFKQKTGECFSNYLIRVKMNRAAELLNDIRYKTYEISEMVGYSNTKNFTRTFKNYYGKSPKEYRNQKDTINPKPFER